MRFRPRRFSTLVCILLFICSQSFNPALSYPVNAASIDNESGTREPIEIEFEILETIERNVSPFTQGLEMLDDRVSLAPVPARTVAALRFSGWATKRRVKSHTSKLVARLEEQGISTAGQAMVAQYDPPFRLPFMRRNEILVEVISP